MPAHAGGCFAVRLFSMYKDTSFRYNDVVFPARDCLGAAPKAFNARYTPLVDRMMHVAHVTASEAR